MYQSKLVVENANSLAEAIRPYIKEKFETAVRLHLTFGFRGPNIGEHRDKRPDLENLEKQIIDVLEKLGLFDDDKRVASKVSDKLDAEVDFVRIRVEKL